jgi:hypothetical protein
LDCQGNGAQFFRKRGHTVQNFINAQNRTQRFGIDKSQERVTLPYEWALWLNAAVTTTGYPGIKYFHQPNKHAYE